MRPHLRRRELKPQLSACIEWLFADGGRPFADRVRAAADAGFQRIEVWTTSNKDVAAREAAINETGVTVTAFVSEPTGRIVDPQTHDDFVAGVERSCELARRLHAESLIVVSGDTLDGVAAEHQARAIADALRRAAPIAHRAGVFLVLEPLNTRVDHAGYFLESTRQGIDVVRRVDHPSVRLLYDLYHSIVMGEEPADVLAGAGHLVGHVHLADAPGRHEPGTGTIDWPRQLAALRAAGYTGPLGLEYMPLRDTESSLAHIESVVASLE